MFRSWGRVGTAIGGTKLETFRTLDSAMSHFLELYLDKTGQLIKELLKILIKVSDDIYVAGNSFLTKAFQKYPNKFFPLDIDYSEENSNVSVLIVLHCL